MDDGRRVDHMGAWSFTGQHVGRNPLLKPLNSRGHPDVSTTIAEHTAAVMMNGAFDRRSSLADVHHSHAGTSSMGFPGHTWSVMPTNLNATHVPDHNLEIEVKEMRSVLGLPTDDGNGDVGAKPLKGRKPRAPKGSNTTAPKGLKPKQPKKESTSKSRDRGHMADKSEKKNLDIVINGATFDISCIPVPVCSCTGVPHQCYRWGTGGWQSSCCTTSMSVYPLPLSHTRPGARIAGRKMSIGAYRKALERAVADGHNLSDPVDLKNYWAKHGTNKFVTIR